MVLHSTLEKENVHIPYDKKRTEYHRKISELVVSLTPSSGKVLDIGCGLGHILEGVANENSSLELYAADCFENCLEYTRRRVGKLNSILMGMDGFDIDSLGTGYDTCVMSHSLEHMQRPLDVLHQVMTILNPGGHLIVAVPNPVRPLVIFRHLTQSHYVNKGHVYAWDKSHWKNFLERVAGLNVVAYPTDEVRVFPQSISDSLRLLKLMELGIANVFPWLSHSNIAVIKK